MRKDKLTQKVIHRLMDRAIEINRRIKVECRDFTIMTSTMRKNTLLLRWTTINIDDVENPIQCYYFECFYQDGSPQNCSVNYSDQQEANDFFYSLKPIYHQQYARDHREDKH